MVLVVFVIGQALVRLMSLKQPRNMLSSIDDMVSLLTDVVQSLTRFFLLVLREKQSIYNRTCLTIMRNDVDLLACFGSSEIYIIWSIHPTNDLLTS